MKTIRVCVITIAAIGGCAAAAAALYAADGDRRTVDGRVVKGRAAIEQQLAEDFKGRFKGAVVKFAPDQEIRHLGADLAIVDGSATLSGAITSTGAAMPPTRYFHTIVVAKRDGAWQILALRNWAAPTP